MADFAASIAPLEESVFLVFCHDHTDGRSAELRLTHLAEHLTFIEKNLGQYLVCGPVMPTEEAPTSGSFFLVTAADTDAALAFLDGDPYAQAGVYARRDAYAVNPVAGRLLGGVAWTSVAEVLERIDAAT